MDIPIAALALSAVLALAVFMGFLNLAFWRYQRAGPSPIWLSGWLYVNAAVALCRLLQHAPLDDASHRLLPRVLLSTAYLLVWLGYELANAFISYRPRRWERWLMMAMVGAPIVLIWTSNLVLTDQLIVRELPGGTFRGVTTGSYYLPVSLLMVGLSFVPIVRLLSWRGPRRNETTWLALGYILIIVFGLNDFLTTALNLRWIRLSDFSFIPIGVFFTYLQIQRLGHLYRDMDELVRQRTAQLNEINDALRSEIAERELADREIRRRAGEINSLFETTQALLIERDLATLLRTIVERAAGLLNASGGGLYLAEPENRLVRCVVSYNTGRDYQGVILRYGEGAAGRVAETGEALVIDDYRLWEGRAAQYERESPFRSVLSVPMRWQGNVIGVIHILDNTRVSAFSPNDLPIIAQFANQATIAVENAHLFEAEKRRRQEAAAIAEVGRDISASLQLEEVFKRIALHARDLLRTETGAVYLCKPGQPWLEAIAAIGPDAEEIKRDQLILGEGILGNIASRKVGEIVNETSGDSRGITIPGTSNDAHEHLMGAPIMLKERLTGLIAVWRIGLGQEFHAPDLDFLNSLSQQAAIAIENARLFEETQKRLREFEGLAHVSAALSRTLELDPLLETILQSTVRAIPAAERGSVLLADGAGNLYIRAVVGYDDRRVREYSFPPDSGYASLAFHQNRAIIVADVRADPRIRFDGDIPEMLTGGSAIAAPLIAKGRTIGVIAIDTTARRMAFGEEDIHLLEALSSPAALAIENARLFDDTRRRLAELEVLQTVSKALRIALTPDDVFPIILKQLISLLGFDTALVDIIAADSREIVTVLALGAWAPMTGKRTPLDAGGSGRVIATGEPYLTTEVIADGIVAFPELIGGLNAAACVPIIAQHQPVGTIWVGRRDRSPITKEEVNLLLALGEMMGSTVQRMKLHEQTVNQAIEIALAYDLTLEGWAKALELRDKETEGHSRRVSQLTLQLARYFAIPEEEMVHIRRGVLLHDIGKMGIPDHILKKPGPLDEAEWREMKNHPQYAYDLIHPIAYLRRALDIPYCHHERWDGSGYPRGLKGEHIPQAARIFAVVDVYDALSSDRPYRAAWPEEKVLSYLRERAGVDFDPEVVTAFLFLHNHS